MFLTREQAAQGLEALHFNVPMPRLDMADQAARVVCMRQSVQFDPLDVVGINMDLVMQSRIPGYEPQALREALYGRFRLIDGYDKNLCIYPAEDYPYFARVRRIGAGWWGQNESVRAAMDSALELIDEKGPVCSDDLPFSEKVRWPWGHAPVSRAVLETLWTEGKLIVHHKNGVRRYFDRIEKYLPKELLDAPDPNEREEDYRAWLVLRRIKSVGLLWNRGSDAWLGTGLKKPERDEAFRRLLAQGVIEEIEAEGVKDRLYAAAEYADLLKMPVDGKARVIAPLDCFMWDRKLIEALYGFRYRWEVYVPAEKREYGYYVLPVLCGGRMIARFEPDKQGNVKAWWWEGEPSYEEKCAADEGIHEFQAYVKRLRQSAV